jgi:hypothetical protein
MMQAALYNQEPVELPAGGIATFLTAQTGSWADDDDYPTTGIGSIPDVADKLAEFGRYEDTYMVHAAEGETVIPMEVFDKNPALKDSLFAQMREMGIEPEEYIVGSELNSLNPVTGQPEFFLKKLFRGLKKAVKKVFKVVAPIVVQALLTPILGPYGASAATGFLQAKVSGASTKDAFKAAGIAALTTGIVKGAQGFASAGKGATFGERMAAAGQGVKSGFTGSSLLEGDPSAQRPNKLAQLMGAEDVNVPDIVDQSQPLGTTTTQTATKLPQPPIDKPALTDAVSDITGQAPAVVDTASIDAAAQEAIKNEAASMPNLIYGDGGGQATDVLSQLNTQTQVQTPSIPERFTNIFTDQGGGTFSEVLGDVKEFVLPSKPDSTAVMRDYLKNDLPANATNTQVEFTFNQLPKITQDRVMKEAQGSLLNRYAVPAALAVGANYAMTPEVEEGGVPADFDTRSALEIAMSDPTRYGYGYNTYGGFRPAGMADGGSFPPRDGAIAGPGTGTSDDIPAMLSDGEFVMTAQAVRGAGDGSRKQGMRRMYDMMRNFESAA